MEKDLSGIGYFGQGLVQCIGKLKQFLKSTTASQHNVTFLNLDTCQVV